MVTSNKEEEHPSSGHTNENGKILMIIGILLPKLFWPTARKNVLVIEENFWNSRLKAENLQNFWDHKDNSFKQWKARKNFVDRMIF